MLVDCHRLSAADRLHWKTVLEPEDRTRSRLARMGMLEAKALSTMRDFATARRCYVGTSWGKDSTVVAHLAWRLHELSLPVLWVRVEPLFSPECVLVRDVFLSQFAVHYEEVIVHCTHDEDGWHAKGTLEKGFTEARRRHGCNHISGIRGEESSSRKKRMQAFGVSSETTCAPIGYWKASDVFAYLYKYDLPVHPAYAMTRGGLWDRSRLRVASLGGRRGRGMGRVVWEQLYYPELVRMVRDRDGSIGDGL